MNEFDDRYDPRRDPPVQGYDGGSYDLSRYELTPEEREYEERIRQRMRERRRIAEQRRVKRNRTIALTILLIIAVILFKSCYSSYRKKHPKPIKPKKTDSTVAAETDSLLARFCGLVHIPAAAYTAIVNRPAHFLIHQIHNKLAGCYDQIVGIAFLPYADGDHRRFGVNRSCPGQGDHVLLFRVFRIGAAHQNYRDGVQHGGRGEGNVIRIVHGKVSFQENGNRA